MSDLGLISTFSSSKSPTETKMEDYISKICDLPRKTFWWDFQTELKREDQSFRELFNSPPQAHTQVQ